MTTNKLPYARKPEYLSPTALFALEADPIDFYLSRCAPFEYAAPKSPQTLAMAAGSAFDAYVKAELSARMVKLGRFNRVIQPEELLVKQVEPHLLDRCRELGADLLKKYVKLGCLDALLDEGVYAVDLEPEGREVPGTCRELLGRTVRGVPIKGHPDAALRNADGEIVILDWKVTGAESGSASPTPGYFKLHDTHNGEAAWNPPHDRSSEHLETINPAWASQLATYSWLLRPGTARHDGFRDVRVAIDQLVCGENGRLRVARFRTTVSGAFQECLRDRYAAAWARIQEESLVPDELARHGPEVLNLANAAKR